MGSIVSDRRNNLELMKREGESVMSVIVELCGAKAHSRIISYLNTPNAVRVENVIPCHDRLAVVCDVPH